MIVRRRIVALLVLLALVALLVWGVTALVGLLGDRGGPAAAVQGLVPADGAEDDGPVVPEACAPRDVDASVTSDGGAAGGAVALVATLTNDGELPCLLDAGSASLVLTVTSGEDRVWSSGDCGAGPAERRLLLDVGDSAETSITWDRTRSEPGCPGGQRTSGAGTYQVEARLGDAALPASRATFALG